MKLYAELKEQVFEGDYSRVTEFIRRWRKDGGATVVKAFLSLQFEPGESHQFDWSEEHIVFGRIWRKVLLIHFKLSFAKIFYPVAQMILYERVM